MMNTIEPKKKKKKKKKSKRGKITKKREKTNMKSDFRHFFWNNNHGEFQKKKSNQNFQ